MVIRRTDLLHIAIPALWVVIAVISAGHLLKLPPVLNLPSWLLGALFITGIGLTLFGFSDRGKRLPIAAILFVVFLVHMITGPFLEPPADQLDHLRKSYLLIDQKAEYVKHPNRGLWHYSMTGLLLRAIGEDPTPERRLAGLSVIHALYCALLSHAILLTACAAGLPMRWALAALLLATGFFGTNKFSFFSYYSFAPSFSSMLLFWLWTARFFLCRDAEHRNRFLTALAAMALLLPVLVVNHMQEAVFCGFVFIVYLLLLLYFQVGERLGRPGRWGFGAVLFLCLYLLPQVTRFRDAMANLFVIDDWDRNQELVVRLFGLHLTGKFWDGRILDTLGLMGLLVVPLGLLLFMPGLRSTSADESRRRIKIYLLGALPLIGYTVPLFNFIWVSNCEWTPQYIRYYYRLSYCSYFWLALPAILHCLETRFLPSGSTAGESPPAASNPKTGIGRNQLAAMLCCLLFVLGGMQRQAPFFGKVDFILTDGKPWWPSFEPIVAWLEKKRDPRPVLTDPITALVLGSVFNQQVVPTFGNLYRDRRVLNLDDILQAGNSHRYQILVNLRGYEPSWVGEETAHWSAELSKTYNFYIKDNLQGAPLVERLKTVVYPQLHVFY